MIRVYDNVNKVNKMCFSAPATPYCRLGQNYYRAKVEVEIELAKHIVDFCDLETYFKADLNGADLTVEELCNEVFETLRNAYKPHSIKVTVNSDSHFPIAVTKDSNEETISIE